MKVVVATYTGLVGKTMISVNMLSPRMNDAEIFSIESINESAQDFGMDVELMRGKKFNELFKKLMMLDNAIIDVGVSNVEAFLDGMKKIESSHEEIDYFLVPVIPDNRSHKEAMQFITELADQGVPREKIKVIFNRVADDVEQEFPKILSFAKKEKLCIVDTEAAIYDNEVFNLMALYNRTIDQALKDETDYKALAMQEKNNGNNSNKITRMTDMHVIKLGAKPLSRNLDAAFKVLFC